MMTSIFLKILNMCLSASWIVMAVIVARFALYKAPKWIRPLLWGIVGIRLLMPFSIESIFSLIPSAEVVNADIVYSNTPSVHSGVPVIDGAVNPVMESNLAPMPESGTNFMQLAIEISAVIWAAGMIVMLIYAAASYISIHSRVRTAVRTERADCHYGVFQSEYVKSPFVLGLTVPRIILPYSLPQESADYVIRHEKAHIERKDHWWKAIGFLLLAVYWFNPLLWLAYILLCRDIESACDERVIADLSPDHRAAYSQALLLCSVSHKRISACPLAFGETNVKSRIRQILSYKKPAFWLTWIAVAVCVVVAVCFLTNPKKDAVRNESVAENDMMDHSGDEGRPTTDQQALDEPTASDQDQGASGNHSAGHSESMDEAQMKLVYTAVHSWAGAFISRDGEQIAALSSEALKGYLASEEGGELLEAAGGAYSFGMSSPWPWEDKDYEVFDYGYENRTAVLYYYAMTSEPHVTVWKETLNYDIVNDEVVFTGEKLTYFDSISSMEEFLDAYAVGISGTMMDYEKNDLGEVLNQNAMLAENMYYADLFEPSKAAVLLLNLDPRHARVSVEGEETSHLLTMSLSFDGDGESYRFSMEQPFHESGIWIPLNYKVNVLGRLAKKDWNEAKKIWQKGTSM